MLAPGELTIVGNVGDDLEVLGLHVSPDLDSVLYGLAGLNDTERGWGRAGETWQALESARAWGGEGWFMLGDLDIGLHLVRSQALRAGEPLSAVTARLTAAAGLATRASARDRRPAPHAARHPEGTFAFQEWFVARGHEDAVDALVYEGAEAARPAPGVLEAIAAADAIVIAPSNPFVSIHPILAVPGISGSDRARAACRAVAVSPLIGGLAVRGPLDRMMQRLVGGTTPEPCDKVLQGPARRARDRPRGRAATTPHGDVASGGHRYAHGRPRGRSPARRTPRWRLQWRPLVKIALVGGTGSFGTALAVRLRAAGLRRRDRLARRRAGAAAAAELGVRGVGGATNEDAVRAADLVVLATKAEGAVETARSLRDAIGTTPVLSVAAELSFTKDGRAADGRGDVDRAPGSRTCSTGPSIAGLHSLAASNLGGEEAPDEDTLVCGDDPEAKALVLELAGKLTTGSAIDAGPLASARALEGMTAVIVNVNKRYKAHAGLRVTGVH